MTLTEFFVAQLEREARRSRRALEQFQEGQYDWKPHDRSMIFGYLADMVATIPTWISFEITKDELDIAPVDGAGMKREPKTTSAALVAALDTSLGEARSALQQTTDEFLATNWQLKARGEIVQEAPRHEVIQDTFNHWAHHRGQMTVYLRLMGATVPALYGPSADDKSFG